MKQCHHFAKIKSSNPGGVLLGRYTGPGWTDQPPVTFDDQHAVGQWVVVQKNYPGNINIAEIYVTNDKSSEDVNKVNILIWNVFKGEFVWDYSEEQVKAGYTNWSDGEPNNHDDEEECVEKNN